MLTVSRFTSALVALSVTLGGSLVASAAPLDIHKSREVLLDPGSSGPPIPWPDPKPDDQVFEMPLPIQQLVPSAVWNSLQLAQNAIQLAQQLNQPAPQWATDIVNAMNALREVLGYALQADLMLEVHGDPGAASSRAGGFGILQFGPWIPAMISGDAGYEQGTYSANFMLHGIDFAPIDYHQSANNPLSYSQPVKGNLALWSTTIAGIALSLSMDYRAQLDVNVTPTLNTVDFTGGGSLILNVDNQSFVVADEDANAGSSAFLQNWYDQGPVFCGQWYAGNALTLLGTDQPQPFNFQIGDGACTF